MKRALKNIVIALTIAIAVVCACAFTACGDSNESATEYSVLVVYDDNTPVKGSDGQYVSNSGEVSASTLKAQWCLVLANGETSTCYPGVALDDNGKATAGELPELGEGQKYHIQLNNLPQGAEYDETATYVTAKGQLKIIVTKA
jgi:hypothetical protein